MRKRLAALIIGAALLGSSAAGALSYTLSAPVAFNNLTFGISGTLNPVTDLSGTAFCLSGTCTSGAAEDWLLVSVTLDGGSNAVDRITMSVAGVSAIVGVGHFGDPDETPTSGSVPIASQAWVDYDNPNVSALNLEAGETTDRLFAAFSPVGSLPGPGIFPVIPPGTASFVFSSAGGANFSVPGTLVLVPEPGTLLLLGGGLIGVALAGRRRL
jgi:PEP-CTERM motif